MKVYIKTVFAITIAILIFTGCSVPSPILEKAKEHFQVKIDPLASMEYPNSFSDKITYISDEKLLYFDNVWNDKDIMLTNIYIFSLSGNSKHLITIEGVHVDEIVHFNNKLFILARKGTGKGIDITLICMNENWSEMWRYEIKEGLSELYTLDNVIALLTFPIEPEGEERKIILLNMAGEIQASKILNYGDGIIYMSYIEKEDNIFVITLKSENIQAPCELQKWTKEMKLISTLALPFLPIDANIEDIINVKNENLLIMNENVYTIGNNDVTKRIDIYSLYEKYVTKKGYLPKNQYINSSKKRFNYLGEMTTKKYETIPLLISFNDDFTNASLRYLDINNHNILCAFEAEDGRLTIISKNEENEDGILDIYQW